MQYQQKITDAPKKDIVTTSRVTGNIQPKRLNFDQDQEKSPLKLSDVTPIVPGNPIQPFKQVDWVYPNDEESQFYSYEQMLNDWVPSDVEEESSSDDENEDFVTDDW